MSWLEILILCAVFIFAASLIELIYLIWAESRFAEKRTVKKRLLYISAGGKHGQEKLAQYRSKVLRDVGTFERLIFSLPRSSRLDRMLIKAGVPINASVFILFSLALGGLGFLLGFLFLPNLSSAILVAIFLLALPFLLLRMREKAAFQKFQEQLPEALDLLARALRSGHALSAGFEMVAEEMSDPIRAEFRAAVDEVNLGLSLKEALDNMCARVASTDLRFFAIAVLMQRETGGNIAEILDKISELIRERIYFLRQVRVLTAEGRLSGIILVALPIVMFFYIYLVNYKYISLLWTEKVGIYMLAGGGILMIVGALVIRRIVTIEM